MRYDTSGETFTGMAGTLGSLPAEVKRGIREANHNVITAKDPAHPNPSPYPENGTDKDSYFGDPLLRRAKPARDVQYGDYSLAASSSQENFKVAAERSSRGRLGYTSRKSNISWGAS